MKKIEHALRFLERGFSVIPCRADKRPLIPWEEYQTRRPTEAEVRSWWTKHPSANIGLVCGSLSGLTVVDCDSPEAWEALGEYLPDSLMAPVVLTPSGNRQIYFKHAPGLHSQNRVMPDMDIKTDGGYVIAPPSACEYKKNGNHIKGAHRWQAGEKCGIPEMPEPLFSELQKLQVYCGASPAPPKAQHIIDVNIQTKTGGVESVSSVSNPDRIKPYQSVSKRIINLNEGTRDESLFHPGLASCQGRDGHCKP